MAWNDPRKALANCKSAGFPSMTGRRARAFRSGSSPRRAPAGKGQQMAKNQHADARGTQKIVRQVRKAARQGAEARKTARGARAAAEGRGAGGEGTACSWARSMTWLAEGIVLLMFVLALVLVWHAGW